jgi:uncharacterized iron-regulated membrane protein
MAFKKIILFIHRWLGFMSGLVVFIVSITGCIFCFQDEIQDAIHSWRKVEIQNKPYISPSALKNIALTKYPGASANDIYYFGVDRPAAVLANVKKQGYTYVYINPYNAQLLHIEGIKENFFTIIKYIHLYLLLPEKIGQMVVGVSVIIFVVLMITGIVLWWPKRKTDRKRSLTIKWNARWRRINYDLHNVLGFYATSVSIILALTGLSMAFSWVNTGIYKAANLGESYPDENVFPKSDTLNKLTVGAKSVIDRVFFEVKKSELDARMFLIADNGSKSGTINITAYRESMHFGNSDDYYYDRNNGKLLKYLPNAKKSAGMKLTDLNYDIHVGQIWGLTSKIIAFLASLICATLPITGFIIWLGKRKKPKKQKEREVIHRRTHKQLFRQ